MVKYRLTKVTPDYDEPGVWDLTTQAFRSENTLITHAADCLRRLISFEIDKIENGKVETICSYNFFNESGLTFSESCPYMIAWAIKITIASEKIFKWTEGPAE